MNIFMYYLTLLTVSLTINFFSYICISIYSLHQYKIYTNTHFIILFYNKIV